jgi:membrane protein YdbS with pleckstrin-like domain
MQDRGRIVLQDKPSSAEILVYWSIAGGLLTIFLLVLAYFVRAITLLQNLLFFLAFAVIVLALVRMLIDMVERELSLYVLTQDTLTTRRGLNQRINSIPLEHVQQAS